MKGSRCRKMILQIGGNRWLIFCFVGGDWGDDPITDSFAAAKTNRFTNQTKSMQKKVLYMLAFLLLGVGWASA